MKGFFVILALCALLVLAQGEDIKEKFNKAMEKCKEKINISKDEFQKLQDKDIEYPYSHEAKCFLACFFEEGKVLQDGKYNKDNALVLTEVAHKDNPEETDKAKQVVENCVKQNPEVGADKCEFAYKMAICGVKESKNLGLEHPDFF